MALRPAGTTFKTKTHDMPGTSSNGGAYSYWNPGYSYFPVSTPAGSIPDGYPPGPSHVQNPATSFQTASNSMSTFPVKPGVPSSVDYVATPCPDCGQVIKVSSATTYHMDKHRESQRCKRATARRSMKEEEAKASALRTELFNSFPGPSTARGVDQGEGSVVSGNRASAVKPHTPCEVNRTKGKSREVTYSMDTDLEKRYCDAGVQVDFVLPQQSVPEKRSAHKVRRRCHSEPPLFYSELQADSQGQNSPSSARHAEDKSEKETIACIQCADILLKRNVRSHVGAHVLRQLVGAPESTPLRSVIHSGNPCGFCGRAGCNIRLVKAHTPSSKYTATASNCSHAHTFSLNKARRFSTVMPCTNVPIQCALCPKDPTTKLRPVYWKYNMFHHIQTAHPDHWDWRAGRVKNLGVNFRRLLSISQRELDVVAPGRTRPYPGPVGEVEEGEEEPVIANKRAAVEALIRNTDGESSPKRPRESETLC